MSHESRECLALRLIYVTFSGFLGWMVLHAGVDATREIEILVPRHTTK
jgi:hypothetical protein